MVNPIRVVRVVWESVYSVGWSEQLEGPVFGDDYCYASLDADGAIALCDDGIVPGIGGGQVEADGVFNEAAVAGAFVDWVLLRHAGSLCSWHAHDGEC